MLTPDFEPQGSPLFHSEAELAAFIQKMRSGEISAGDMQLRAFFQNLHRYSAEALASQELDRILIDLTFRNPGYAPYLERLANHCPNIFSTFCAYWLINYAQKKTTVYAGTVKALLKKQAPSVLSNLNFLLRTMKPSLFSVSLSGAEIDPQTLLSVANEMISAALRTQAVLYYVSSPASDLGGILWEGTLRTNTIRFLEEVLLDNNNHLSLSATCLHDSFCLRHNLAAKDAELLPRRFYDSEEEQLAAVQEALSTLETVKQKKNHYISQADKLLAACLKAVLQTELLPAEQRVKLANTALHRLSSDDFPVTCLSLKHMTEKSADLRAQQAWSPMYAAHRSLSQAPAPMDCRQDDEHSKSDRLPYPLKPQ